MTKNKVLLSFDIEEFDLPRERGASISLAEGVKISSEGTEKILDFSQTSSPGDFFCDGEFC